MPNADDIPPDAAMSDNAVSDNAVSDNGYSTGEQLLGVGAAYRAPLTTALVTSTLFRDETNPVRRGQLGRLRRGALIWWGFGAAVSLIMLIVVISIVSSHGGGLSGACKGGRDEFGTDPATYQSDDGTHWTATYPCINGGSTTVPIARRLVPGEGS